MTKRELMERKGWSLDDYKRMISGFWNEDYVQNLDGCVSLYDLWCDKPFAWLNREYNRVYHQTNGEIGSTYEWLENTATDEEAEKYIDYKED